MTYYDLIHFFSCWTWESIAGAILHLFSFFVMSPKIILNLKDFFYV